MEVFKHLPDLSAVQGYTDIATFQSLLRNARPGRNGWVNTASCVRLKKVHTRNSYHFQMAESYIRRIIINYGVRGLYKGWIRRQNNRTEYPPNFMSSQQLAFYKLKKLN